MAELLATYKAQQNVERGFRFLKSPEFLTSSLYLKKPERIEALPMVMTYSLQSPPNSQSWIEGLANRGDHL